MIPKCRAMGHSDSFTTYISINKQLGLKSKGYFLAVLDCWMSIMIYRDIPGASMLNNGFVPDHTLI